MSSETLVPTRVGMIPSIFFDEIQPETCPHTRGDDPEPLHHDSEGDILSPHAWG